MIKIWDDKEKEQDVFLYLKNNLSPDGVTICAKDKDGNHLYAILTIHKGGIHFHNLKNFTDTPFPLVNTNFDGDRDSKRIIVSRM